MEINGERIYLNYLNNDEIGATRNAHLNETNLLDHLNEFTTLECPQILLISNDYSYVIFKQDNGLFMFDSHSKTPTGRQTDSASGTASVIQFNYPNAVQNLNTFIWC